MKKFSLGLSLLFIILFSGCATNKKIECPKAEPIVIHETLEIKVPTKMKRPNITCSFNTEDDMFNCIVLQKRIIEELTIK